MGNTISRPARFGEKMKIEYRFTMLSQNALAQDLLERIIAVQAALQTNFARKAGELGLTVAQATVAQDLASHPGSSLLEVCTRLGWPKSTVSRLVDDLVGQGLATREIPEENRRTVVLDLAPSLRTRCLSSALKSYFPGASGTLDAAEAKLLRQSLDRILALLRK
jgi:DNA-binding MarR family transcriptional regulator